MITPHMFFLFRALSHETTSEILLALYEHKNLRFTDLKDLNNKRHQDIDKSLKELTELNMIEKHRIAIQGMIEEHGYKLTYKGFDVVKKMMVFDREVDKLVA